MKDSCKGGGSGCCGSRDGHQCSWPKKFELEQELSAESACLDEKDTKIIDNNSMTF